MVQKCMSSGTLVTLADGTRKPISAVPSSCEISARDPTGKATTALVYPMRAKAPLHDVALHVTDNITCSETHGLYATVVMWEGKLKGHPCPCDECSGPVLVDGLVRRHQ